MRTISVVTDLAAPVEAVWAELSAVERYAEWNPFITAVRGELVVGNRLEVRISPPGGRPLTFRPTVTHVEPGERLEWLGHALLPGLFDGRHSFALGAVAGGTRLTQAEDFSGLLASLSGTILQRTRAGFEAMNEALRRRVESARPDRPGATERPREPSPRPA